MPAKGRGGGRGPGKRRPAPAASATLAGRSTTGGPGTAADATSASSPPGRLGKYNAAGERVNGKWMASAAEAERYRQLSRLEMNGIIDNLQTQTTFLLTVNNRVICRYRADFCYDVIDDRGSVIRSVIEDVKGMVTPEFVLKHKLFDALQPVPLTIIQVKGKAHHSQRPTEPADSAGWMDKHWKDRLPD